ncbi:ATP-binding protein [Streptomyces sp. NBC_01267]|uniref:ATP-binding protein n=1 Tax=unclassified Streptomyces TaxID=2593676 RepID=UPI00202495CB|nr:MULTISPECIES: ATP-binding protein [unclassified Streptomyces]MCX4549275.1 ATP-binding protein [Streptomyces sp. NBC_01500]
MTPAAPRPPQGGEFYRIALPSTANAPCIARDFVASLLTVSCHRGLVDDARLCVTEVVTNAHRHTRTPRIQLCATVNRKQVTVSVADNAPWFLPVFTPSGTGDELECGRGLMLLDRLAFAWGWTLLGGCAPDRKAVWFTLARAGAEGADEVGTAA